MKVEVLQVENADFRTRLSWWSKWVDVAVFDYGGDGYLLQMRVSRTNSKQFVCRPYKALIGLAHPSVTSVGDLIQSSNKSET